MPAVGLEYRYPFVSTVDAARHAYHRADRPDRRTAQRGPRRRRPNEDAQSLVFDDTNIFEVNKFSGYDRVEGGVRANYGAKYTLTTSKGYADVLFGQSYQVAGRNSYLNPRPCQYRPRFRPRQPRVGLRGPHPHRARSVLLLHGPLALRRADLRAEAYRAAGEHLARTADRQRRVRPLCSRNPPSRSPSRARASSPAPSGSSRRHWSLNGSVLFDLSR